jgi:hypothetical protein
MTATDSDYDAADDFAKSIEVAYAAVRERMARGGSPWLPRLNFETSNRIRTGRELVNAKKEATRNRSGVGLANRRL